MRQQQSLDVLKIVVLLQVTQKKILLKNLITENTRLQSLTVPKKQMENSVFFHRKAYWLSQNTEIDFTAKTLPSTTMCQSKSNQELLIILN